MITEERRNAMRVDINCKIYCKSLTADELHEAVCVTLSGSGISFISEHAFEVGDPVEVSVVSTSNFFIEITRCDVTEKGMFEMGASILDLPN